MGKILERNRYYKHYLIPDFGKEKQNLLKNFKVLVVGVGGLGSPVIIYLSTNGVGKIGIVDFDSIDITNLHRQILYSPSDIGRLKTEVAKEKVKYLNPEVNVETFNFKLKESNSYIVKDYDFIIEATDNIESKLLINDICIKYKKPFSYAGINRFFASTTTIIPGKSACLRCVFKNIKGEHKESGVFGTVPGLTGIIQATEAIKFYTKTGELLTNKFLFIDLLNMKFRISKVDLDKDCKCYQK